MSAEEFQPAASPPAEQEEKDFVLFVNKEGIFSGDFAPPSGDDYISPLQPPSPSSPTTTGSQSAVNEETGEINWDCPCLQSALAPPCGEFFREAFACFVASTTEPKGSDCLEKFGAMQDCFRAHPEVYLKGLEAEEEEHPTSSDIADGSAMNEDSVRTQEIRHAEEQRPSLGN